MQWENTKNKGFTIVELLIVVVVIAILAAITIVSYNGISLRASDSLLRSDIESATKQLLTGYTTSGAYPSTAASIKKSDTTSFQYTANTSGFCITATSSRSGVSSYFVSSTITSIRSGACPRHFSALAPSNGGVTSTVTSTIPNGLGTYVSISDTETGFVFGNSYYDVTVGKVAFDGSGYARLAGYSQGYVDGQGGGVGDPTRFGSGGIPLGADATGMVYVADTANNTVRMVTQSGYVSTIAGTSTAGDLDGTGSAARFTNPSAITIDASGTLYVADATKLRKVTPAGVVTTITTVAAPVYGMAVDSSGTIYLTEQNLIRKVTSSGASTVFAGATTAGFVDASGTTARFSNPRGLAVDGKGNVYVADTDNKRIRTITPAGVVTTLAGSGANSSVDGTGTSASFTNPTALTLTSNNVLYVFDNNIIRKVQ